MLEHKAQDRTGKIFKQVLSVANEQLAQIAGLELVCEADTGAVDEDEGESSQVPASQAPSQMAPPTKGAAKDRYVLVNKLANPVTVPLTESEPGQAIYLAFVEVVLTLIQENEGVINEEDLFGYLNKIGLERKSTLPLPAEQDKIENLVQKRLVAEAYIRRRKKEAQDGVFEYLHAARSILNRDAHAAAELKASIMKDK